MALKLRVFDPALCCSTGVCGTTVDPELARFAGDVEWLKANGVIVDRFNLAQQPGAFVEPTVKAALETLGEAALPLLLVGTATVATGHYPTREVLARLLGVKADAPAKAPEKKGGCCGSDSSCC